MACAGWSRSITSISIMKSTIPDPGYVHTRVQALVQSIAGESQTKLLFWATVSIGIPGLNNTINSIGT
eukprot:1896881-Rhodomonas_salina.1